MMPCHGQRNGWIDCDARGNLPQDSNALIAKIFAYIVATEKLIVALLLAVLFHRHIRNRSRLPPAPIRVDPPPPPTFLSVWNHPRDNEPPSEALTA